MIHNTIPNRTMYKNIIGQGLATLLMHELYRKLAGDHKYIAMYLISIITAVVRLYLIM